ncbi:MAG TPA: MbnP family copper-binding protein [Polyangiaceae bacterium]
MHARSIAFIATCIIGSAAFAGCGDESEEEDGGGGHGNDDHGGTSGSATGGSTTGGSTTGGSTTGGSTTGGRGGSTPTGGRGGTSGSSGSGGVPDGGVGGESGSGEPGGEGGAGGTPEPLVCPELGSLCHAYDLGPGPQHDCHEVGHHGDEEACRAQEAACRTACGGAATIPFTALFGAKVGTEPFSCASSYANVGADASTIRPVDFKFYVHDVRLIDAAGMEVPATLAQDNTWQYQNVALLDFEDDTNACANGTAAMNTKIVGTVPTGTYRGIVFKLGVPFALNHTDVTTAPAPLNLSSMFWSWNSGHLFLSLMTSAETGATTSFENVLHVGSTGCVGDAQAGGITGCAKPNRPEFRFPDYRLGRSVAVADVKELLQKSNLKTDLCHSFTADTCTWPFEYLGINWFTGSLTPTTQRVFRME